MKAGKVIDFVTLTISLVSIFACSSLHEGLYLEEKRTKIIRINKDSSFTFWAYNPKLIGSLINVYSDGNYLKCNNNLTLFSSKKDKDNSIKFIESINNHSVYDTCFTFLLNFEVERSNFTMLPSVSIRVLNTNDSVDYQFSSDSILLVKCDSSSVSSSVIGQIIIYPIQFSTIKKVIFKIGNIEYPYILSNSKANSLDIILYDQQYDTVEYRQFLSETWKIKRNRIMDMKNNEVYKFESNQQLSKTWNLFLDQRYLYNHN
jgi:hypothetical protein